MGKYLNFREPLRTLECAGLYPLIGQASQKGLQLEAAAHPSRGGAHGSPPRESSTAQWPHLPPSLFSRTLLEEWHSQLLPWLGEDREALNAAQGNTAGSQRCPLQHALPFDSWCCCIFCPAFSSTSRTEPAKMDYRGPRKFTQDQQGQNSLTSSPLTVPVSILFSCLEK